MKIIIYTASSDKQAKNNYLRLVESRQGDPSIGSGNEKHSILEFSEGELVDPKKILENMRLSDRESLEIEFIAHGSSSSNELLIMTPDKIRLNQTSTYTSIKPQTICDFFNENGKDGELYKFKKITLFCCESLNFGKALSELMPGVNITCFNEEIYINENGIAHNAQGALSKPYTFYEGKSSDESKEKKSESSTSNQAKMPSSSSSSSSSATLSVPNRPYIIHSPREKRHNNLESQHANQKTEDNKASLPPNTSSLTETDIETNKKTSSSSLKM